MKSNFIPILTLLLVTIIFVSSCAQYGVQQTKPATPTQTTPTQPSKIQPAPTTTPTQQPTTAVKEFSITADDASYSPSGSINVKRGDKVKITFNVKTSGVRFGGLDFRSSEFDTGTIKPGNSKTVEFVADKSFSISSYWPGSNTKKPYTIQVVVQ